MTATRGGGRLIFHLWTLAATAAALAIIGAFFIGVYRWIVQPAMTALAAANPSLPQSSGWTNVGLSLAISGLLSVAAMYRMTYWMRRSRDVDFEMLHGFFEEAVFPLPYEYAVTDRQPRVAGEAVTAVMVSFPCPYSASSLRITARTGIPSPWARALTAAQRVGSMARRMYAGMLARRCEDCAGDVSVVLGDHRPAQSLILSVGQPSRLAGDEQVVQDGIAAASSLADASVGPDMTDAVGVGGGHDLSSSRPTVRRGAWLVRARQLSSSGSGASPSRSIQYSPTSTIRPGSSARRDWAYAIASAS